MPKLIDLSHSISDGMLTYQGLPAPRISEFMSREDSRRHYADDVSFCIHQITMPANTGTYLDSPFHRYSDGMDLAQLPLEKVAALDGLVCRVAAGERRIDQALFAGHDVTGKAVLVHTGWSRHWGDAQYGDGHPWLTRAAAEHLVERGAALVGIDSMNIDDTADPQRPVHSILLRAGIPIIEHMCRLEQLPDSGFTLHAAPVKVERFGTFPVRVYAVLECQAGVKKADDDPACRWTS